MRSTAARRVIPYVAGLAWILATTLAAAAQPAPSLTVVELYTSEGCSSCPPAEALLEKLAGRADLLPLAFHVDYWDQLGWRDKFSLPEATARQQSLAQLLRVSPVGTPQFIVAGRRSVWGANPLAIDIAVKASPAGLEIGAERRGNELLVAPISPTPRESFDVYVVGYLPKAITPIKRGENAGRTLTEINVVRSIQKIGSSRDAAHGWRVALDRLPKDAERLAILIQSPASGAILGARLVP